MIERAQAALDETLRARGYGFDAEFLREMVESVIEAIREPDGELFDEIHCCSTPQDWRRMIDTILGKDEERDHYAPLPDSHPIP